MSSSTTCLSILASALLFTSSAAGQSGTSGMEVAPGLRVNSDAMVWALDNAGGTPALHPILRNNATVTSATKSSPAPQEGSSIGGARASVRIHAGPAVFYVQYSKAQDDENHKPPPSAPLVFALVRLRPGQNKRVVAWYDYSSAQQAPTLRESVVEGTASPSDDFTWLKITPAQPLTPGEYAIVQLVPAYDTLSTWIFDFGVD